jgi:hypothetical protein
MSYVYLSIDEGKSYVYVGRALTLPISPSQPFFIDIDPYLIGSVVSVKVTDDVETDLKTVDAQTWLVPASGNLAITDDGDH